MCVGVVITVSVITSLDKCLPETEVIGRCSGVKGRGAEGDPRLDDFKWDQQQGLHVVHAW